MAITNDLDEFLDIAHDVGIPDPRAEEIYIVAGLAFVIDRDGLAEELNMAGYYDEKADHLLAGGTTLG